MKLRTRLRDSAHTIWSNWMMVAVPELTKPSNQAQSALTAPSMYTKLAELMAMHTSVASIHITFFDESETTIERGDQGGGD